MRIAVLDDYQQVALAMADWSVLDADIEVFSDHVADPDALVRRLAPYDVVVLMRERTPLPAGVIDALPALRLVVTTGRRNAVVDVEAARARGITVCGTDSLATAPAELTWALVLGLCRHLVAEDRNVRAGGWQTTLGRDLAGHTLGVVGLGRIGSQVTRVGPAFGMDVLAEATRHLIGRRELGLMRADALLVNTSRAGIVDTEALLEALAEGRIGGAGLDVYDEEPLPADHPLRTSPRTLLTPHVGYVTEDVYRTFFSGVVEDIAAFTQGAPVRVL